MRQIKTPPSEGGGPFAVMDLGTNTFHLLIAEGSIHNFREIVHEHVAVKIGEGGINKGIILPFAFERGVDTMKRFKDEIDRYGVQKVRAIATSALRNASNGKDFIERVKAEAGIEIEIINGDQEACFIYEGVKAAGLLTAENSLIMDIGGGSVEFIVGNHEKVAWKQSFEIGAARLMEQFHHTDPMSPASIEAINMYLAHALNDLLVTVPLMQVYNLIGSSGSFETFAELAANRRDDDFDLDKVKGYIFDYEELILVTDEMIRSTHAEREANDAVIPVRVDMIVVSSIITRFILHTLDITNVALCTHSLKEGVLAEMMK